MIGDFQIIEGDCRAVLPTLPAGSAHCVVTSPPYWGLRDYSLGDNGIGLEETPDEYIDKLVAVFREVRRVLRDDGMLWLNMGDSYAAKAKGSDKGWDKSGLTQPEGRIRSAQIAQRASLSVNAPHRNFQELAEKNLIGVPWRVAFALQSDGWILRSGIIWHKPNPMPESVTDRPTKSHEYVFLLSKRACYFYDAFAIREDCQSGPSDVRKMVEGLERISGKHKVLEDRFNKASQFTHIGIKRAVGSPDGRNKRDVWTISTEGFPGAFCCACRTFYADGGRKLREHTDDNGKRHRICLCGLWDRWLSHFATFPRKLVEPCIKAGTSDKGCCPECGAPWMRVVDKNRQPTRPGRDNVLDEIGMANRDLGRHVTIVRTVGWEPGCKCQSDKQPVPCTVLDPFAGSGTTGVVARQLGRQFVGIELNPKYCEMARRRMGNPEPEPLIVDVPGQLGLFVGCGMANAEG